MVLEILIFFHNFLVEVVKETVMDIFLDFRLSDTSVQEMMVSGSYHDHSTSVLVPYHFHSDPHDILHPVLPYHWT